MKDNFWKRLTRPIYALAPMANVTDAAFRFIIAKYSKYGGQDIGYGAKGSLPAEAAGGGGPDVMFTEFTSCDGLCSPGRESLLVDLKFTESERPMVAQFFGSKPENFYKCALLAGELGFDGIDINMGCPDRAVEKQGGGAALIKSPELAQEIIDATKRGAGPLPVSVKTRLGYNQNALDEWLPTLLKADLAAVIIHARTRKEMSRVAAHWEAVARAVKIRDEMGAETLILGNGDIRDIEDAKLKIAETGCDGVMIGRGIFGNPWLFNRERDWREVELKEKLSVMLEHTELFEKIFSGVKSFDVMKKHYKAYVAGWDGAKELRTKLMAAKNAAEVNSIVMPYLIRHPGLDSGS